MTLEPVTTKSYPETNLHNCEHVQFIPGVVSNATSRGLLEFAISLGSIHGYVAVAVCLFGVLANSANIIVLTRKHMASSTNILLLWLAVADLLTMLEYLPFVIHFYIMAPGDPLRPPFSSQEFYWTCFLLFHASFSIVCHSVAIWLTIALAIFRYIYICKPTTGVFYCSQRRARGVVIIIIVLTIIICIPNCVINTYSVGYDVVQEVNSTSWSFTDTSTVVPSKISNPDNVYYYPTLRQSSKADEVLIQINNWIHAILIKLIPCFLLTVLTLLLIHAVHKAYRKRLKLKSQGRKAELDKTGEHNRLTAMLLAIVVLFTLTELPQGILTLINIFVDCFYHVVYSKLGDLLDLMALINNAVNFVLYCTMSTQFRATFAAIFCPRPTAQSKWMKLRLVKSRNLESSYAEATEFSKTTRVDNFGCMSRSGDLTDTEALSKAVSSTDEQLDSNDQPETVVMLADECNGIAGSHNSNNYSYL
ncbi:G-protein coupled receptor 139 [Biomphalaria pfeifferi]|uniref:G-protein coupled receptor 139 n=1 Tax=Biomphalaria pfeifferi TaxID=112525 RepID=A0AAD8BEN3_BIOPF|nr:G-protein coupled receptor 139 [Biomphalaria pfeifferi]